MPKIKPSETELRRRAARGVIFGSAVSHGVDDKRLCKITDNSICTVRKRKNYPDTLTLGEIWALHQALHFTQEQMVQLISGEVAM